MEPTEGNSRSSYVAGLLSDARPLDTGPAPRRNTEGGIQSADKSLINRRLKRSISCSVQIPLSNNGFDLLDRSKWSSLPGRCFLLLTTDIRTTPPITCRRSRRPADETYPSSEYLWSGKTWPWCFIRCNRLIASTSSFADQSQDDFRTHT
jgi:hypothetical protein